jgi:methionine-rich copper-binding protein CopC
VPSSRRLRRVNTLLATVLTVSLWSLISAGPALAHDKLVGSDPADASSIDILPAVVTLHFEEPPGTGFSSLVVLSPSGRNIGADVSTISGSDMSIRVTKTTEAGLYTIEFHIVSDDGHPVGGVLHFTLTAARSSIPPSSAPVAHAKAGSVGLGWIAGGAVAIAALTLVRIATRKVGSSR